MKEQLEQTTIFNAVSSFNYFQIQKCDENENKFNGVHSINNLPKRKDWAYVINLDKYKSVLTDWIALYVNGGNIKYFNSLVIEHIPKKIKTS